MKNKTALFLKTKHIGDSIILTSSIAALPSEIATVDIICFRESYEIFKNHPKVRHIFIVPRHLSGVKKIVAYIKIIKSLLQNRYDFIFQFSDDWRGALLTRLLNPINSCARNSLHRGKFWKNSFRVIANISSNGRPAAEQDVDLLRKLNLFHKAIAPPYEIFTDSKIDIEIKKWLIANLQYKNSKTFLIHGPSRWSFKEIPIETWVEVIDFLNDNLFNVILTGALSDKDYNYAIARKVKKRVAILESTSVLETASLYKNANFLISIDSMALHLASAMGLPTLAIFGPTNEENWAPWQISHKIITISPMALPSFNCRPCGQDGCGGSKVSHCLTNLSASAIIDGCKQMIKQFN